MQIGIDIRCLMHTNYSGVPEYAYNLLNNLFLVDRQNQYKLFYNSNQLVEQNIPDFSFNNVSYVGYKYPNKLFNSSLKFFNWPKLDQLLKPIDLFFMPNFNFISLSKKCSKVLTVHDISFNQYPQFYTTKRNIWHNFINPKKILANFNKIITDSENTKKDLINDFKIDPEKIKVIYLGVDHGIYKAFEKNHPNLKLIKDKYQLPDDFILSLGTIEPRKNIESLIQAFDIIKQKSKYANLYLVIAGAHGWKYQNVQKLANKSKYKNYIKFIGYIKREEKPYIYNLASVFVFPSYYEGFGLPVLEAQACGTPVIAGLNSSLTEICGQTAILINPFDINALARSIKKILNNNNLKKDLVFKAVMNCKNFTWQKTAKQTLEYLTS